MHLDYQLVTSVSLFYCVCWQDDMVCSAYTTAQYIKHTLGYTGKVYVVGNSGIGGELEAEGIAHTPIEASECGMSAGGWCVQYRK